VSPDVLIPAERPQITLSLLRCLLLSQLRVAAVSLPYAGAGTSARSLLLLPLTVKHRAAINLSALPCVQFPTGCGSIAGA